MTTHGMLECFACGAKWPKSRRVTVVKAVTHKCCCHRAKARKFDDRPYTLRGTWKGQSVFDHAAEGGPEHEIQRLAGVIQEAERSRMSYRRSYSRYMTGYRTAFSPDNADLSLHSSHRVLVKHQDGTPPATSTITYVRGCVELVDKLLAVICCDPLRVIFSESVVVSHTLGKHPFLSNFGGLFKESPSPNWHPAISIGCKHCDAGIHELAHAIDALSQGFVPSKTIPQSVLKDMIHTCNSKDLDRLARMSRYADESDEVVAAARAAKIRGRYWRRPEEQFARAWEQFASAYCAVHCEPTIGVAHYDALRHEKGQWDVDANDALDWMTDVIGNAMTSSY